MEISDYLRTIGKRAWLLALIPALAGIVAAVVTITQPAAFRTSATLQLPRDPNASPQQVAQQFVDFRAAANNNVTIERVADETGVAARRVRKVRIEQVGQSNFVTMTYVDQARNAEQARAIMTSLAEESLVTLNEAAIDRAQGDLEAKQQAEADLTAEVDRLQGELNAVYARVGTTQLADEQRTVRTQQASFQEQAVRARAQGLNGEAQAYEEAAAGLQQRIDDLRFALAEEASLKPQLDDARTRLRAAQAALITAEAAAVGAAPAVDINFNAEASPVRRKARTARLAGAAVLAGIPVAVALILLLDLVSRRRSGRYELDEDEDEEGLEPEPEPASTGAPVPAPARGPSPNGPGSPIDQPAGGVGNGMPASPARAPGLSMRDERGSVGAPAARRGRRGGRPSGASTEPAPTTTTPESPDGADGVADAAGAPAPTSDEDNRNGRPGRSGPPRRG